MNNSTIILKFFFTIPIISPSVRIILGLVFILISSILLVNYFCVLYLTIVKKDDYQPAFRKFLISLSCSDLVQLVISGLGSGVMNLSGSCPLLVNKTIGSIMNACWFTSTLSINILALNRFITIVLPHKFGQVLFADSCVHVYIGLMWLYGVTWFVGLQFCGMNILYDPDQISWSFVATMYGKLGSMLNMYVDMVNNGMMLLWYMGIYAYLKFKVRFWYF